MQQHTGSRWPRRLLIFALLITLSGTIIFASSTDEINSVVDPRLNNEVEFQGTGTQIVNISSGCYRAISITGDSDFEATLTKLDGSARVGEALDNKNCMSDFQAMSSDQTNFKTIASWQVSESAEYALDIECSDSADCQQQVGWFVSIDDIQYGMFGSKSLIIGTSMCLMGILLLPLSAILMAANKSKGKSKLMMVNADGTLTPITNLNDAAVQQFNNGEMVPQNDNNVAGPFADSPITMGETVAGPFADSGIGAQDGSFVDGTSDVQRGTMMTTDQVYALMRGDVEGASELFQDPFLTAKLQQTPSEKQQQIQQQENDILISSWDEGDSDTANSIAPVSAVSHNKRKPISSNKEVNKSEDDSDSWKQWDEM